MHLVQFAVCKFIEINPVALGAPKLIKKREFGEVNEKLKESEGEYGEIRKREKEALQTCRHSLPLAPLI